MYRAPKASTIGNHNAAMQRVFDVAIERGYMAHSQVPVLTKQVRDSERRPDFSVSEYGQLYRFMRRWIKQGKGGKSRDMRVLLRDYVLILANTGMRHGTESYGLKSKHITEFDSNGVRYLTLWVKGKTGSRELVARHRCVTYLQRIHQNTKVGGAFVGAECGKQVADLSPCCLDGSFVGLAQ